MKKIGFEIWAVSAIFCGACMTDPYNGTTVSGTIQGKSISFSGYHTEPNVPIHVQILRTPTSDPVDAGNWVNIAITTTGNSPSYINSTDPLYYWSVSGTPVAAPNQAARFAEGGVARVRAVAKPSSGDRVLTTFDEVTFQDCLTEKMDANESWMEIGIDCKGMAVDHALLVSTKLSPADTPSARDYLSRKGLGSVAETNSYYNLIGAPSTLNGFKNLFGFPANETTATYYNNADLGVGREMHCRAFPTLFGSGIACYVSNYSNSTGGIVFGGSVNTALNAAIAHQGAFATVAMVFRPPAGQANSVQFMVYDAGGARATNAALDSTGEYTAVPNNCLSCHGISASFGPSGVSGAAQFLPFDPHLFKFSTQSGYTLADQQEKFRRLNAMVKLTSPSAAITDFIDGIYAPSTVQTAGATANDSYIPSGWKNLNSTLTGEGMYLGIVKIGCRGCHMSSTNANLDFLEYSDFTANRALILNDVCDSKIMPHAERTLKNFWASGARAYLLSGFGAQRDCKP